MHQLGMITTLKGEGNWIQNDTLLYCMWICENVKLISCMCYHFVKLDKKYVCQRLAITRFSVKQLQSMSGGNKTIQIRSPYVMEGYVKLYQYFVSIHITERGILIQQLRKIGTIHVFLTNGKYISSDMQTNCLSALHKC